MSPQQLTLFHILEKMYRYHLSVKKMYQQSGKEEMLPSPVYIGKRADGQKISVVSLKPQALVVLHQGNNPSPEESDKSNFVPLDNLVRFSGHPDAFEWDENALKELGLSED